MVRWNRVGDVALALLAIAVAVLLFVAWKAQSTPVDTSSDASQSEGSTSTVPTSTAASSSGSATASSSSPAHSWTLAAARTAIAKPGSTILVLGDSTSNDDGEWVSLWADYLSGPRNVTYQVWNADTQSGYTHEPKPAESTPRITIWNASMAKADPSYAVSHWSSIRRKADVVILNYGHSGGSNVATQGTRLSQLLERVTKDDPDAVVVGIAQNPQPGDADKAKRAGVVAWNKANGVPTIDVAAAFVKDGRGEALVRSDLETTAAGSVLWEQTVSQALGTGSGVITPTASATPTSTSTATSTPSFTSTPAPVSTPTFTSTPAPVITSPRSSYYPSPTWTGGYGSTGTTGNGTGGYSTGGYSTGGYSTGGAGTGTAGSTASGWTPSTSAK